MTRRTKEEMQMMRQLVTGYLNRYNMEIHTSHEALIKNCLESGNPIPYYVKGVKDFEKVASELKQQEELLNRESSLYDSYEAEKKNAIQFLMESDVLKLKLFLNSVKDELNKDDRFALMEWIMFVNVGDRDESNISVRLINVVRSNLVFEEIA